MSKYIFYFFIVFGVMILGIALYSFLKGSPNGNEVIIFDLVLALFAFYRAYRIYKTKQDQELM